MNRLHLINALKEAAHTYRLSREAKGAAQLKIALELLTLEINSLAEDRKAIVLNHIPAMLTAQTNQDWLGLADYLEFDIPHLLQQEDG